MIMAGCSSAGEMVMMGYCCRSSSLSHSGVRREREMERGDRLIEGREGWVGGRGGLRSCSRGEGTHPNWPSGYMRV